MNFFREIERKNWGIFYTSLCLRSAELSKAFGLSNLCYSKISLVILLGYRITGISRKLESERKICPAPKCCIFKKLTSYMPGAKSLKQ